MQNLRQPQKFEKGIVRFEEKSSFFKPRGVYTYAEA